MLLSFAYLAFSAALRLLVGSRRSEFAKDVELSRVARGVQKRGHPLCDFLTVETVWLTRIYVLFFVSLERRRVEFVASTSNPDGRWVAQQARNLLMPAGLISGVAALRKATVDRRRLDVRYGKRQ